MSSSKQKIISLEKAWFSLMRTLSVYNQQEKAAATLALRNLNSLLTRR